MGAQIKHRKKHNVKAASEEIDVNGTVVLTKDEYLRLKSKESTLEKYQIVKQIGLVLLCFVFFIALAASIRMRLIEIDKNDEKLDMYYENDLKRVTDEIASGMDDEKLKFGRFRDNYRPGRVYHRGGNYGRNKKV